MGSAARGVVLTANMLRRRLWGMCRMSCGLVSLFVVAVRRSRLRHDHRHDLCRIGNALLNSNMAGHMVVARRTMGAQVPGTWYLVRATASSSLHSATAIAAILAEFCILHVDHVKRVDF